MRTVTIPLPDLSGFVTVLDQHPVGAAVLVCLVSQLLLFVALRKRK